MEKSNQSKSSTPRNPLVSVIVTTKNEAQVLDRLLKSVKTQSYTNTEIIVVDNHSTDSTSGIAKQYTTKVYELGPERSVQRNFGVEKSQGKFVVILDADMQLSEGVIKEAVEKAGNDGKIGAIVIPEESVAQNFWEKVKGFERSFYNLEGDVTTDAARFIRKSVFEKLGGYDEKITGPEDWDLPERISEAGYKIGRIKSVISHHERIPSLLPLVRKKYYYALKSYPYFKKHKISVVSPKTIYLLRPVFYRNWRILLSHPVLSVAMFIMLTLENIAGGMGYLVGRLK